MLIRFAGAVPVLATLLVLCGGCAEGFLWRTGYLSPRVRDQWNREEQIAATLFGRREEMRQMVANSRDAGIAAQEDAARKLAEIAGSDPVLLLRVEAVDLLADMPGDIATDGICQAAHDREPEVRRAAIRAMESRQDARVAATLAALSRQDDDLDVQIAATAGLGNHRGSDSMAALKAALEHPNPAMQLSAARSLEQITGKNLGYDIQAWQQVVGEMPDVSDRYQLEPESPATAGREANNGSATANVRQ
jgi:HEAT repeat protein